MEEDTQSPCYQVEESDPNLWDTLKKYSGTYEYNQHSVQVLQFYYIFPYYRIAGAPIDFEVVDIDPDAENNEDLEYAITTIKRNGVGIKGNIETKSELAGVLSRNVALRNELDLYVNILHCQSYPGVPSRHKDVDIVIIRCVG